MYQTATSTIKDLMRRRAIPCLIVGGKYRALDRHLPAIDEYFERQAASEQAHTTGTPRRRAGQTDDGTVPALRARRRRAS